jgi:hypothetical protein
LTADGLIRVEKDADGKLWGLFAGQPGLSDSWQYLDLSGSDAEQALEDEGLMTVMPASAGSVGFGV